MEQIPYIRKWSLLSGTIMFIVFGIIFGSNVYLYLQAKSEKESWEEYANNSVNISENISRLKRSIGYGGFIHHFKNYLLRKEQRYAIASAHDLLEAKKIIEELRKDPYLIGKSKEIEVISQTFENYARSLDFSIRNINEISTSTLDDKVRVDDRLAFDAFDEIIETAQNNLDIRLNDSLAATKKLEITIWISSIFSLTILFAAAFIVSLIRKNERNMINLKNAYDYANELIKDLKYSEAKFSEFDQGTSEWFWEQDQDLRFTSITNAHPLKVSLEDGTENYQSVIGKRREDTVDEDIDTPKWRDHFEDLKNHRPFRNFSFKFRRADGTPAYVSISGSPVFNENGEFLGYRGTGRDVTEDRTKTSALLLAEERLRVAFEAVTCGIIVINREAIIQSVNPQVQKMFGYTDNEMLGNNVSMLMSGDHAAHHDRYISNYIETGDAKIIGLGREVSGTRKDGSEFPLFLGIGEMNLDGNRQFIASLTDLTTQRHIEHQLRRAQKMDAMGQLTGGLAHDFNNLLGIIIGNLELAQRKAADIPAINRNLEKALAAAGRGTNLTRRLLNFSRQTPTDLSAVDLNEVVSEFRNLAAQSVLGQTELQIHLDPSAPEVLCNQSDLEDALLNISINARDAMPDGGRFIIETGSHEISPNDALAAAGLAPGHYGTLTLSDTGIGMPPEIQERIFEPFFTTKAAGKGTGLGMPMVYGFVQRSKGHVAIYSEQGLGTTIRLYLPVAEEIRGETNPDLTDASKTALPIGTEKILIVDDEAGLREIAETALSELGYRTAIAENGDVALSILQSTPDIDLLFTDLVMPGSINGLQLAETILKERPDLKVLLTSGFSGQIMNKESAERWAGALLSKPYTNAQLAQAIRSKLDEDP